MDYCLLFEGSHHGHEPEWVVQKKVICSSFGKCKREYNVGSKTFFPFQKWGGEKATPFKIRTESEPIRDHSRRTHHRVLEISP